MFDKKPSVSVIIPAYNEEKYLETTLKSVVNQYYDNLELIVVPNGCTDKTADIAEKFTVNIYETDEKSISLAKNIGYEKALDERFGKIPSTISNVVNQIKDRDVLKFLLRQVIRCNSMEEFKQVLNRQN